MCKLEGGHGTNISMIVKGEFDPKELLENVLVRTSLERRAETGSRNDAQISQNSCVLPCTMEIVLNKNAGNTI